MKTPALSSSAFGLLFVLAPAAPAQPTGFPSYGGMIAQMQATAASFPAICRAVNVTQTYGAPQTWLGQDIWGVKISDNVGDNEDEPAFLMVAAHHGNEYGTPIVALDAIARLTEGYAADPRIQDIVDGYEIWILPCCNPDGYWTSRHNRRPGGTVDLNRNYPFNWGSPCNSGVRGPGPGSEPEVQNVLALSAAERFTKVLDFHSSGRETLYGYRQGCPNHRLLAYLRAEAVAISTASSYGGSVRGPSSDGEHYHHQLGTYSNYAFLTEISNTQSPTISSALTEASRLWPGTLFVLERPIPVWGHITDSVTGAPIEAQVSYVENPFTKGEKNPSEPRFGRYHAFLPEGNHTLRFSHPCYITQEIPVTVGQDSVQLEVALVRRCAGCVARNGSGINPTGFDCVNLPVLGSTWSSTIATTANTVSTHLGLSTSAAQTPLLGGELLLGLTPIEPLFQAGLGSHSVGIPNNNAFLGLQLFAQGFRIDNVGPTVALVLLNGQDLTLGLPLQ